MTMSPDEEAGRVAGQGEVKPRTIVRVNLESNTKFNSQKINPPDTRIAELVQQEVQLTGVLFPPQYQPCEPHFLAFCVNLVLAKPELAFVNIHYLIPPQQQCNTGNIQSGKPKSSAKVSKS